MKICLGSSDREGTALQSTPQSASAANNAARDAPLVCIFWCAVAMGGLVQGRPIDSVRQILPVQVGT